MIALVPVYAVLIVLGLISSAWAVPAQTLLLIILTIVTVKTGGNVRFAQKQNEQILDKGDAIHEDVLKAKANATHAASAAAAAAATARDSSRIVKDVGSLFRETKAVVNETETATDPTGTTDPKEGP